MSLNKASQTPLYVQLKEIIKQKISSGEWGPGYLVPSENEIVKMYQISRITVRQALHDLTDEGYLLRKKGKGTFVNGDAGEDWHCLASFTEEVQKQGHVPSTKILTFSRMIPPAAVSEALEIKPSTECFYLKRLRMVDNEPVCIAETYIPVYLAPDLTPEHFSEKGFSQSIFHVLEQNFGVVFHWGEETTGATCILNPDATLLGMAHNTPTILKACLVKNFDKKPIIHETTVWSSQQSKKMKRM